MKKNKLNNIYRNVVKKGRHGIENAWKTSCQTILNIFKIIMKEPNTTIGRINLGTSTFIFFLFSGMHVSNFIRNLVIIVFSKDIVTGNSDKLFYSMIIYFAFSLIMVALDNKKK